MYIDTNNPKFIKIVISDDKIEKLENFIKELIKKKSKESHYKQDNQQMYKRHYTGFLGELAVEQYLEKDLVDYSIGNAYKYKVADLHKLGFRLGVKTVENGKCPVIKKRPIDHEVICIKLSRNTVALCGVASIDILKKYSSDDYILDKRIIQRGEKTAFYGFDKLINIRKLYDRVNNGS
jgi:hypothetical protein